MGDFNAFFKGFGVKKDGFLITLFSKAIWWTGYVRTESKGSGLDTQAPKREWDKGASVEILNEKRGEDSNGQ